MYITTSYLVHSYSIIRADFRFSNCYLIIILSLSSFVINKEIISYRKSIIIPYNNLVIHLCFSVFSFHFHFWFVFFFFLCVVRSIPIFFASVSRNKSCGFGNSCPSQVDDFCIPYAGKVWHRAGSYYIYYISTICTNKLSILLDAFALV